MLKTNPTSIYIHVPFCRSICSFCDFKRVVYNASLVNAWLKQLSNEINCYSKEINNTDLLSIYIGGGTPSCLTSVQFNALMDLIDPWIDSNLEITLEANPEDITSDNVKLWVSREINRISLGVESFDPCMLEKMNRSDKVLQLQQIVSTLKANGLTNISFDLMYGLPDQTINDYKETLLSVLAVNPNHISSYCLTIEENSKWAKLGFQEADEQIAGEMMELTTALLNEYGYYRYEVSNYAKKGYESKHNQTYWHYDNFIGFGFGSSGKANDKRYDHAPTLMQYCQNDNFERLYIEEDNHEIFEDYLMMNLRLKQPLLFSSIDAYYQGDSFYTDKKQALAVCQSKGYLSYDDKSILMSDYGLDCLFDCLVLLLDE